MKDLNALRLFAAVAEMRSFSLAAESLCLTPSGVSKAVTRLEAELGVKLLHRTTRSVDLTPEGAAFFDNCRSVLSEIAEAEAGLTRTQTVAQGRLRVQLPIGFGGRVVMPALTAFTRDHPGIVLDVELGDRIIDVIHEGLDAAVIIGTPADPRLVARRLCRISFGPCASPGYLAEHGEPQSPEDLDAHRCLGYVEPRTGSYRHWQFTREGRSFTKVPGGQLNVNNSEALLRAAIAGAGIAMLSTVVTAEAVNAGLLRRLLPDYAGVTRDVWVVYAPSRNLSARVRAFVDFLFETVPAYMESHGL